MPGGSRWSVERVGMRGLLHPLQALAARRLTGLPEREQEALRRAVEAEERRRSLLHRRHSRARTAPHPIALTPFVLPRRLVRKLHELARTVHRFQSRTPDFYLENALNFRDLCPLDGAEVAWLSRFHRMSRVEDLMIRLDVGLSPDGKPALYETNSTALAGLFNHTTGVRILRETVFPRLFARGEERGLDDPPDLLALTFDWVTERAPRAGRRPGVAFIEPAGPMDGYSELPQIACYFRSRGVRAACGKAEGLELAGGKVILGGRPVDLVYRDVAFQDLGEPPGSGRKLAGLMALLDRHSVIPGFAGEFDHKAILECLTSDAYRRFFTARERGLLAECVPWTRLLGERRTEGPDGRRIDLPRFARLEKHRLVLKPSRGSGGEDLFLGQETPAAEWEALVDRALKEAGRWVIQEHVPAARRLMVYLQDGEIRSADCYFSLGLFYVWDRLGLHCRISRFQVVNVGRGGALACVFVAG
jgi:hypothetical protein